VLSYAVVFEHNSIISQFFFILLMYYSYIHGTAFLQRLVLLKFENFFFGQDQKISQWTKFWAGAFFFLLLITLIYAFKTASCLHVSMFELYILVFLTCIPVFFFFFFF
jgi:hypothetical protein